MPPKDKSDPNEVLALAATQLDRATAATAHLLEQNDAHVRTIGERVSVLEQRARATEARLKKIESLIEGTLTHQGLQVRFHGVEAEIKRLVDYMGWIDRQFKSEFFKDKEVRFSQDEPASDLNWWVVFIAVLGVGVVALITAWLLQ